MWRARLAERLAAWAHRRQGDDATPLTLQARRLYILPTRTGLAFGVLLFVMLVAGLNYTNSLALLLTFTLTAYVLVGMYECQRTLQGLEVTEAQVLDCYATQPGTLLVQFANSSPALRRALTVRCPGEAPTDFEIPAAARATVRVPFAAPRRGRHVIDRLELATTAPFGLFRAWTWLYLPLQAIVYPQPLGARPLPRAGFSARNLAAAPPLPWADEEQWSSLRPFQSGDSPRRIAWKVYARGGPLMVGQYEAQGGDQHLLSFAGLEHLDIEARLSQLSAWVGQCARCNAACALQLPGARAPLGRGTPHYTALLQALALYAEPAGAPP